MLARSRFLERCLVDAAQKHGARVRCHSSWIAPHKRRTSHLASASSSTRQQQQQQQQHRPMVNGKRVAFHVNDLVGNSTSHQSYWNGTTASASASSSSIAKSSSSVSPEATNEEPPRQYESDLVVLLDMDECLIHSRFLSNPTEASVYAHQLKQTQQQQEQNSTSVSHAPLDSLRIALPDGEIVHVHVRPGLADFLAECCARYETHIFTAAMSVYANPVLDALNVPLAGRWYREHCTFDPGHGAYVKDFTKLPLQQENHNKVVLVDNNPLSFLATPDNGVLVNSFYTDVQDGTLPRVMELLKELEHVDDVRPVLTNRFALREALHCPDKQVTASVSAIAGAIAA